MSNFSTGLPPNGTDISNTHLNSVLVEKIDKQDIEELKLNSILFLDDDPKEYSDDNLSIVLFDTGEEAGLNTALFL